MAAARQQKAYMGVVEHFRKKIRSGEIKPGEKLPPEREIAENLGVSRNSVREAIKFLDMSGVIDSQQGSGNYVTCDFQKSIQSSMSMMMAMHQVDYSQISQVRYSLERQAYELSLRHATEEEVQELEGLVKLIDESDDEQERARLDKRLHYTIAKTSGNTLLLDILEACSGVIDDFVAQMRVKIMSTEVNKELLNSSHRELVEGLRERDHEKGMKALDRHFYLIDLILEKEKIIPA